MAKVTTADAHNKDYVGYFQVIEQSDDEKIKMYMKLTKRELAEMLISANRVIEGLSGSQLAFWDKFDIEKLFKESEGE